jgi:hypothetical protein
LLYKIFIPSLTSHKNSKKTIDPPYDPKSAKKVAVVNINQKENHKNYSVSPARREDTIPVVLNKVITLPKKRNVLEEKLGTILTSKQPKRTVHDSSLYESLREEITGISTAYMEKKLESEYTSLNEERLISSPPPSRGKRIITGSNPRGNNDQSSITQSSNKSRDTTPKPSGSRVQEETGTKKPDNSSSVKKKNKKTLSEIPQGSLGKKYENEIDLDVKTFTDNSSHFFSEKSPLAIKTSLYKSERVDKPNRETIFNQIVITSPKNTAAVTDNGKYKNRSAMKSPTPKKNVFITKKSPQLSIIIFMKFFTTNLEKIKFFADGLKIYNGPYHLNSVSIQNPKYLMANITKSLKGLAIDYKLVISINFL